MAVTGLDHVNIRTADMHRTVAFFRDMLDMQPTAAPGRTIHENAWLLDANGKAAVHLNLRTEPTARATGAFHHAALECSGYDALLDRLRTNGHKVQTNRVEEIGLRQIFVHEPNGILLELNFRGD